MLHGRCPQRHTHTHTNTQTSKAARLCGVPQCPIHTETDRGSLSFTRRLKQQEKVTWSETHREREEEGDGGVCSTTSLIS